MSWKTANKYSGRPAWQFITDPQQRNKAYKAWWRKRDNFRRSSAKRITKLEAEGKCLQCEILLQEAGPGHNCMKIELLGMSDVTDAGSVELTISTNSLQ